MIKTHWHTMKYQKVLITGYHAADTRTCYTGTEEQCKKFVEVLNELGIDDINSLLKSQDRRITMNSQVIRR